MRIRSVSFGFVTNSSTYVTAVLVNKNDLIKKLKNLTKEELEKKIDKYFKEFVVNDLNIREDKFWEEFLQKVKKSIFDVVKKLRKFTNKFKNSEFLCLESSCDINGNTIDVDRPEAYALWFILKYILNDIAVNKSECYC